MRLSDRFLICVSLCTMFVGCSEVQTWRLRKYIHENMCVSTNVNHRIICPEKTEDRDRVTCYEKTYSKYSLQVVEYPNGIKGNFIAIVEDKMGKRCFEDLQSIDKLVHGEYIPMNPSEVDKHERGNEFLSKIKGKFECDDFIIRSFCGINLYEQYPVNGRQIGIRGHGELKTKFRFCDKFYCHYSDFYEIRYSVHIYGTFPAKFDRYSRDTAEYEALGDEMRQMREVIEKKYALQFQQIPSFIPERKSKFVWRGEELETEWDPDPYGELVRRVAHEEYAYSARKGDYVFVAYATKSDNHYVINVIVEDEDLPALDKKISRQYKLKKIEELPKDSGSDVL